MEHENEQQQVFYILRYIDYSKPWSDIEYQLGYDLGDHRFESDKTYDIVKQSAKSLWVLFNDHFDSDGDASK